MTYCSFRAWICLAIFVSTEFVAENVFGADKMYWSDRIANTISRANLDGTNIEILVSDLGQARGVAIDTTNYMMYWADNGTDTIQRSMLDGSGVEDLVVRADGLNFPAGIALDVPNGKMYWADTNTRKIQRANLDGSNIEDLATGLGSPYYIRVDQKNGHLYWGDYGTDKIQRSDLDGGNIVDIVTEQLSLPRGLDIDLKGGKVYYTDRDFDQVMRANLDGSGNIEILHSETPTLPAPHGLALDIDRGHMYWVDNGLVTIKRANLNGSEPVTLLDGTSKFLTKPWEIVLDLREPLVGTCIDLTDCQPIELAVPIDELTQALVAGNTDEKFDYNRDGMVSQADRDFMIGFIFNSSPGDSNLDGRFNSRDLVTVFVTGEYEDGVTGNSSWAEGDWNGDLEFDSADMVTAFQSGTYELTTNAIVSVPEPHSLAILGFSLVVAFRFRERRLLFAGDGAS